MSSTPSAREPSDERTYRVFGLVVRSCVPLPAPDAPPGAPVDVEVAYESLANELPHAVSRHGWYDAAPNALLLTVDDIGRYLVTDGRRIAIDRHAKASDADVLLYLLGSAMGALLHQREDLVLHGSAIAIGRSAVGFLGISGSGKSTLAAAFRQRGFPLLTDDLCVVRSAEDGTPKAQPGFPHMKLWADALERLDIPAAPLARVGTGLDKRTLPVHTGFADCALPLSRLYILGDEADSLQLAPLSGPQRFTALLEHTYRSIFLDGLGTRPAHFRHLVATARTTPVIAVRRPARTFSVPQLVERLMNDFAA